MHHDSEPADGLGDSGGDLLVVLGEVAVAEAAGVLPTLLGAGEYWVHSPYADGSFDSRYPGVVRAEQMRGVVRPLLTWLTAAQRDALRDRGLNAGRCGLVACVQLRRGAVRTLGRPERGAPE